MSPADAAQLRHRVPQALFERLTAIRTGSRNWHEWHQTGVLLSELAESARRLGFRNWEAEFKLLLQLASRCFGRALMYVPADDRIAPQAICCDRGLAVARMVHSSTEPNTAWMSGAAQLAEVIKQLSALPGTHARNHQLAIAYGFLARAHWWAWLLSDNYPHSEEACTYMDEATGLFEALRQTEGSPDHNRAYASHLIAMALLLSQNQAWKCCWKLALQAFRLARACDDQRQQARALVVAFTGSVGETLLRGLRDSPRTIRAASQYAKATLEGVS